MEKFIIESRYENWSSTGKTWSNWFVYKSDPISEENAQEALKQCKVRCADIDKRTKLKHEFRLKSYDEHQKELKDLKKEIQEKAKQQDKYFKSDEYKELCKKKRQANKELKERQRKYKETHEKGDL